MTKVTRDTLVPLGSCLKLPLRASGYRILDATGVILATVRGPDPDRDGVIAQSIVELCNFHVSDDLTCWS